VVVILLWERETHAPSANETSSPLVLSSGNFASSSSNLYNLKKVEMTLFTVRHSPRAVDGSEELHCDLGEAHERKEEGAGRKDGVGYSYQLRISGGGA